MKKKIVIGISILTILIGGGSFLMANKFGNKKIQSDQPKVQEKSQEQSKIQEQNQFIDEETEKEIMEENSKGIDTSTASDKTSTSSSATNKSNTSNISSSSSSDNPPKNNSDNNSSSNPSPNAISQVPVWDWLINDFPVSKYGSKESAFSACDKKGEEKIVVKEIIDGIERENFKYSYFCTDVTNVDGIFIGYMLRLKELNTGNDYNWR